MEFSFWRIFSFPFLRSFLPIGIKIIEFFSHSCEISFNSLRISFVVFPPEDATMTVFVLYVDSPSENSLIWLKKWYLNKASSISSAFIPFLLCLHSSKNKISLIMWYPSVVKLHSPGIFLILKITCALGKSNVFSFSFSTCV